MEKQLLFLLEWELGISEEDLHRELDFFLEPLRQKVAQRHARKIHEREEKRKLKTAAARYPSPASSRGHSRSRNGSVEHYRSASNGSVTPPELSYSSSGSSYASSAASSRRGSRSTTPASETEPHPYGTQGSFYESPVQIIMEHEIPQVHLASGKMLPYEISLEQYQQYQNEDGAAKKRPTKRGVWNRILGTAR